MEKFEVALQQIQLDLHEIKTEIIGNAEFSRKGLIDRVNCHEKEIGKLKDKEYKRSVFVGVISGIVGAISTWLGLHR